MRDMAPSMSMGKAVVVLGVLAAWACALPVDEPHEPDEATIIDVPASRVRSLRARGGQAAGKAGCGGGACSTLVKYPVVGTEYYTEFNVPAVPKKVGPTWFVYVNIDWQPAGPKGSDAHMNQFVPQLMLGNPLDGSTGPPEYKPLWHRHDTWVFGSQYFFELFNETKNATVAKAATGTTYPCQPGEILFTRFHLAEDWVWTLSMGVKGDPSRLSTVVAHQPFMGLLPASQTSSWSEPVYNASICNTCWELYGITEADEYPGDDQHFVIEITTDKPGSVEWRPWGTRQPSCPGHPVMVANSTSTPAKQTIHWDVLRPTP